MIKELNCLILPAYMMPEVDSCYKNQTQEIVQVKANIADYDKTDEKVHSYISNPNNKIHIEPAMKKLISIDAEMLTTEKQESECKYLVKKKNDFEVLRFATIRNVIDSGLPVKYVKEIQQLMLFDDVSDKDLIYIPRKSYRWTNLKTSIKEWYEEVNVVTHQVYLTSHDKVIITYKDLLTYSNNRPLKTEEFDKIVKFISNETTQDLALDIMNTMNPMLSFVELSLAFNYLPPRMLRSKKKVLPLMQEIFGFMVDRGAYTLEEISRVYTQATGNTLNQEQIEFIADNYYNPQLETSSVFDFKLVIKKKKNEH